MDQWQRIADLEAIVATLTMRLEAAQEENQALRASSCATVNPSPPGGAFTCDPPAKQGCSRRSLPPGAAGALGAALSSSTDCTSSRPETLPPGGACLPAGTYLHHTEAPGPLVQAGGDCHAGLDQCQAGTNPGGSDLEPFDTEAARAMLERCVEGEEAGAPRPEGPQGGSGLRGVDRGRAAATRHVALKIMYLGKSYHGFASQAGDKPTVEGTLFAALERTRLLLGGRAEARYSRCGRTDKGVSALGQVVALRLRSKKPPLGGGVGLPAANGDAPPVDRMYAAHASREREAAAASGDDLEGEIDFSGVLNRALPPDIRVLGWCPVPPGFDARFSCIYREYFYFFLEGGLDIQAMRAGAVRLVGTHDFRNFCRMDAAAVSNFERKLALFDIEAAEGPGGGRQRLWRMRVRGNAFLWHQVRCMAAVLFLVGAHLEPPSVVSDLLDLRAFGRKPQYPMAPEQPLLLATCQYQGLRFRCPPGTRAATRRHVAALLDQCTIERALLGAAVEEASADPELPANDVESGMAMGQRRAAGYTPLHARPTEPTFEERREKLDSRLARPAASESLVAAAVL